MIKRHFITASILVLTSLVVPCVSSSPEEINESLTLKPDLDRGKKIYPLCATCHMKTGWGKKDGSFPVIAGQHRNVLIKQLSDIRAKNRENPTMYPFTDPKSIGGSQAIADVTAYIASMDKSHDVGVGNGQQLALGQSIFEKRCMVCHGDKAQGNNDAFFPRLSGQHYSYLFRQLKWIRDGYRKNSNPQMVAEVKALSDSDLDAIADYLSRL
ncbi:MAG: cytochrome C [endosymbiont of Galathealinum brachiosum]|uniref:Cytochrome C n=1 Tax=endosymbiont of Galathealinum brachiosum TaxID=2200906 RepID=A0A370DE71_9GAMM|nr:MAG: cytochrome C [endosymbiont of Galathealinum brachiosum]